MIKMTSAPEMDFNDFCYDQFGGLDMDSFLSRAYAMCYIYLFRKTAPLTLGADSLSLVPRSEYVPLEGPHATNETGYGAAGLQSGINSEYIVEAQLVNIC